MLINNFKYSGGAKDAVNYVMSMHDHEGKLRSVAPKILEGNPELTKQICLDFCSNFKHKCVSGVISFRDDEQPTDEQKMEVIKKFKETFLTGMEERVNILFVEHTDKFNCEIHYILNRCDLGDGENLASGGKYFNPFPPGEPTKKLMKLFSEEMNNRFGYDTVDEKPLKTKYSQVEKKCLKKTNHSIKNLKSKRTIDSALNDLVRQGEIKNRKELIQFLKDEGHKIGRIGEGYLSIENPNGGRNIRFKGGIFAEHNGLDYKEVKELAREKPKLSSKDTTEKLQEFVSKRSEYNNKRFGSKKLDQPTDKAPKVKPVSPATTPPSKPIEQHTEQPIAVPGIAPAPTEKPSVDTPEPIGAPAINGHLLSAQMAHSNALAKLQNAKTHLERIRATQEVIKAKLALDKAEQEDFEQKIRKWKI